jgi:hypothetical protein
MKKFIPLFEEFIVSADGNLQDVSGDPEIREYELTVDGTPENDWDIFKVYINQYMMRNFPKAKYRDLITIGQSEDSYHAGPSWADEGDRISMRFAVEGKEEEVEMLPFLIRSLAQKRGEPEVEANIKDVTEDY